MVSESQYSSLVKGEISYWNKQMISMINSGIPVTIDYSHPRLFNSISDKKKFYFDHDIYSTIYDRKDLINSSIVKNGHALDLVCGAGWLALELSRKGMQVEAHELSPFLINVGKLYYKDRLKIENLQIKHVESDLNKVVLPKNSYDSVVACAGLHHIEEVDRLFSQVKYALKKGGKFIIREHLGRSLSSSILNFLFLPSLFFIGGINRRVIFSLGKSLAKEIFTKIYTLGEQEEWGSAFEDVGAEKIMPASKKYFKIDSEKYSFTIFRILTAIAEGKMEKDKKISWIRKFISIDKKLNELGFSGECVDLKLSKKNKHVIKL